MSNTQRLQRLTFAALFAALVAALTCFARLPFPMTNGGVIHLGDGAIYVAACLLPAPYAVAVGAIGAGFADWQLGAAAWIPATIALKACMALVFSAKPPKLLCARNVWALLPASLINVAGYFLYESLVFGGWAAWLTVLGNAVQSLVSAGLFLALAATLDRLRIKRGL